MVTETKVYKEVPESLEYLCKQWANDGLYVKQMLYPVPFYATVGIIIVLERESSEIAAT